MCLRYFYKNFFSQTKMQIFVALFLYYSLSSWILNLFVLIREDRGQKGVVDFSSHSICFAWQIYKMNDFIVCIMRILSCFDLIKKAESALVMTIIFKANMINVFNWRLLLYSLVLFFLTTFPSSSVEKISFISMHRWVFVLW